MPKANKHAEVKPSKYKTSICQFFAKGEECPFAGRCVFAHGEAELRGESDNVQELKASGLQRLDRRPSSNALSDATSAPRSPTAPATPAAAAPAAPAAAAPARRRRPVMVALPKQGAGFDRCYSPYAAGAARADAAVTQFSYVSAVRRDPAAAVAAQQQQQQQQAARCHCRLDAPCEAGRPQVYRHNPYRSVNMTLAA